MQLQERDIEILSTIASLRFMTTQQIHSIHGYAGKYGDKVTRRKLKSLEDKGLLKSWQPSKYDSKIFYLTRKGASEVEIYTGKEEVKVYSKSDKTVHQAMVSELYTKLRGAKLGRIYRYILNFKVGESIADAYLEFKMGDKTKLAFLEADRATERIDKIIEKLDQYKGSYDQGNWQEKYGIFPEVVFVTISDTRKRSLLKLKEKYQFKIKVITMDEFAVTPGLLIY